MFALFFSFKIKNSFLQRVTITLPKKGGSAGDIHSGMQTAHRRPKPFVPVTTPRSQSTVGKIHARRLTLFCNYTIIPFFDFVKTFLKKYIVGFCGKYPKEGIGEKHLRKIGQNLSDDIGEFNGIFIRKSAFYRPKTALFQ